MQSALTPNPFFNLFHKRIFQFSEILAQHTDAKHMKKLWNIILGKKKLQRILGKKKLETLLVHP